MDFQLRAARDGDEIDIFAAYEATLRIHVEYAWGWDEAFQRQGFELHHPYSKFQIIEVQQSFAGAYYLQSHAAHDHLLLMFILPAFQGQGLGTKILDHLKNHSQQTQKPLTLKVVKSNIAAKKLYERNGFRLIDSDEHTDTLRFD